jgi:hypothetical protein
MIDITQTEVDILLAMEKLRLNDHGHPFDATVFVSPRETLPPKLVSVEVWQARKTPIVLESVS